MISNESIMEKYKSFRINGEYPKKIWMRPQTKQLANEDFYFVLVLEYDESIRKDVGVVELDATEINDGMGIYISNDGYGKIPSDWRVGASNSAAATIYILCMMTGSGEVKCYGLYFEVGAFE